MSDASQHLSLRQSEAVARAATVSVSHVQVDLDLTGVEDAAGEATFASTTTLAFDATPGSRTFVDFRGERLRSVTLNGQELDPTLWSQGRIPLADLQRTNSVVVDGLMACSRDGEGMHRHIDPADGQSYLYAMSFLDAAPRWFACFDQPDLKASYDFSVRAPVAWTVLGNGPSRQISLGRWQLRPPQPLSTYFVTLVAGPYVSVLDEHEGIPLGFHVRASLEEALRAEAEDLVAVTKSSLDYYHRRFDIRYPFGEYHQAFVPDFNAGAMENPGCVTLRDTLIFRDRATRSERAGRATTMAHEMAHMWFGDLVSMRWWDDLWLNESFAEFIAHRVSEEATGYPSWTEFGIARKDYGSIADQSPSTHPVAGNGAKDADSARQNFDGISYVKGAAVLKQLAAYLGEDVFWAGLRRYFRRHAYGSAEYADLISAWKQSGAVDLDRWAAGWLRTAGMDTLDVVGGDRTATGGSATIGRTTPAGVADRSHAVQVAAVDGAGRVLSRTPVLLGHEPVEVPVPPKTALVVPDAGDDTWAKIRFGADGWQAVQKVLPTMADPAVRVVIGNGIRDAVRDAELAPATALDLICDAILAEPSDVVLTTMLTFALEQLAGPFCPPADRSARRQRVHATVLAVLETSAAGSDRQLAAFRMAVRSSADPGRLRRWLASTELPEGIVLDRDLTWVVVEELASLTGEAELVEETERADRSGAARDAAARARSRLPHPAAKAAAWRLLTERSNASAYELYGTAEGFFDPGQSDLTAAYVSRYFTEIPLTARWRRGWSLGRVAVLAYPSPATSVDTLALAEEALAQPDLAPAVRRALVDRTDLLRRGVRSLAQWAR